jgi:fatty-acyl-CoA synthase
MPPPSTPPGAKPRATVASRHGGLVGLWRVALALMRAGVLQPSRPDRIVRALLALRRWGSTPAAGYAISAFRFPDAPAVIDERGSLSFGALHRRTNALARALSDRGVRAGDGVAIMCRNHRGMVEATIAAAKLGADVLFLNTAFAGPQLVDVLEHEGPSAVIYDEEFAPLLSGAPAGQLHVLAWRDSRGPGGPDLESLIATHDMSELRPPQRASRVVILTSGTTGKPKGAQRSQPDSLQPLAAMLDKIPLRARQNVHIAAPLFHAWGYAVWTMGLALSQTIVLRRRFDPEGMLDAIERHRCGALCVVPVMLQRTLELPPEEIARHDLSSLRIIAASGSALPGALATRTMDAFGDVLYNYYGSTEVAWATIATPADLRAAPGTAGCPPMGTIVRLFDEHDREVPRGQTGRIFVANEMLFEGYTGGGSKPHLANLMATGDVGHFDAAGRLFVDGRDDEMIVSGGENVFPAEVEDLLHRHAAVAEAAAFGVEDEDFGQRLCAVVVLRDGQTLTEDEVKEYVKNNLARYKVPRDVRFVDALPRNATGKVLKRELSRE